MRRLEAPSDDSGSVDLYKSTPRHHQMFADQLTAEKPTEVEDLASGNRVIEWANSRQQDNHFFDCLVGCHAAASMLGCSLIAQEPVEPARPRKKKVAYL